MTLARRVAVFVAAFGVLAALYASEPGAAVERWLIETLTVEPAARLLAWLAPQVGAVANGARLSAAGGGIHVRPGCEGADLLFLVLAGMAAAPLPWRRRVAGAAIGAALALALNQARVIALFFAAREWPAQFALLHGMLVPLAVVVILVAWFGWYLHRHGGGAVPLYRL